MSIILESIEKQFNAASPIDESYFEKTQKRWLDEGQSLEIVNEKIINLRSKIILGQSKMMFFIEEIRVDEQNVKLNFTRTWATSSEDFYQQILSKSSNIEIQPNSEFMIRVKL